MPKKAKPAKRRAFYKSPPPKPPEGVTGLRSEASTRQARDQPSLRSFGTAGKWQVTRKTQLVGRASSRAENNIGHPVPPAHFTLREDGSIGTQPPIRRRTDDDSPSPGGEGRGEGGPSVPKLIFSSDTPFVRLYHGNSLELLDAIAAKYPDGRFDAIFADPPYFLSNGGITCHAGKMVKVDKGDWDVSRGPALNHEFNTEWLRRCQRVLKPNGTIWVTGTHHVIFSIGYAMQQLGYKILNDIAWEKPNPPPNLSCRYFTHSTETVLWAAKNEKSKHVFNYPAMKAVSGKQMKTVWRDVTGDECRVTREEGASEITSPATRHLSPIWTITAPGSDEKTHGKHPTQKPTALIERCLLASTNEGDLVLDPFLGNGTTAVASLRLKRGCVGIELDLHHVEIAARRADREIIEIWLRHFRVRVEITVTRRGEFHESQTDLSRPAPRHPPPATRHPQNDLDLFSDSINGSRAMDDKPQVPTERIFHECKFVFLSCAQVERGAVVHTTVDISLQEAWARTPNGKKRETTHVVRCETEIFRIKS